MKKKVTNKLVTLHTIKYLSSKDFFVIYSNVSFFNHKKHIRYILVKNKIYSFKRA